MPDVGGEVRSFSQDRAAPWDCWGNEVLDGSSDSFFQSFFIFMKFIVLAGLFLFLTLFIPIFAPPSLLPHPTCPSLLVS